MGCIVYTDYVYPAFVTLLADISCPLFLFRKCFCCCCRCFVSLSSLPPHVFRFYLWLIGHLVTAVSLPDSLFVCICLHPDTVSSVVLISDLLYQSAGIVFLDGGRVSEELVMVSLAFHLFVVGTVSFASVLLCQVKSSQELLYSFTGKCATHKVTKTVYLCKRLTLKNYATTRSIAHITIYNKHKA